MLSTRYAHAPGVRLLYPETDQRRAAIERLGTKIETGTYRLVDVRCPCDADEDLLLATRDRFGIEVSTVICRRCALMRINPRMDEESYARFYAEDYLDLKTLERYVDRGERARAVFSSESTHAARIFAFIWSAMEAGIDSRVKPRMADVGCGSGGMVQHFQSHGFKGSGCDYDRDSIEFGRSKGLELAVGDARTLEDGAPFDVVLLSHVFEHVTSPIGMLDSLVRIMKPGSLLYIELPGIRDISMPRYRNDFLRYLRFVHTFNYSLATLTNVLESRGFCLVRGDEWIHALYRFTGPQRKPMKPLPSEVTSIMRYLRRIERRRHLYPVFRLYQAARASAARVVRRAIPSAHLPTASE